MSVMVVWYGRADGYELMFREAMLRVYAREGRVEYREGWEGSIDWSEMNPLRCVHSCQRNQARSRRRAR